LNKAVVVINSLDLNYVDAAASFCLENGIEHHITESNGKPGKGKNSLIQKFLESDNEYMVPVDGDDYVTPYGVEMYTRMAERQEVDCCVLYKQAAILESKRTGKMQKIFPFDREAKMFKQSLRDLHISYASIPDISASHARRYATERLQFDEATRSYSENCESLCRITFLSRRGAKLVNYDQSLRVGEDTLQYFALKVAAFKNQLNMVRHRENKTADSNTYWYMKDGGRMEKFNDVDWEWQKPFVSKLATMDLSSIENKSLPEYEDEIRTN
tara:strand:- start:6791 stop:7603 length:813 start_codon:yes stop_codon:yes gene_type:complete